jgi:2-succinyl-5-enolpyruvyl-6-hydroxy-3-cyclohexene-1-carboxylate synthase
VSTPPSPVNLNAAWARALVQELVRGGVREAVICPGSRSAPLALACAGDPALRVRVVLDERAAGFFALGAAKATGAPSLVVVTSGTAGAHLYPALLEAEAARVPILVCTADRPPELHGWGAPQTLDQRALYAGHVRFFEDLGAPEATDAAFLHLRATAARAVSLALRTPQGPVHLNAPFREPLAPVPQPFAALSSRALEGDPAGPLVALAAPLSQPAPAALARAAAELSARPRGVIVCGPRSARDGLAPAAAELSARLGYPILADGASNLRAKGSGAIAHADLLLRDRALAEALSPEAVVHLGGALTSKVLQQWIDASGAFQVQLCDDGALHDPAHAAAMVIEGDAAVACREIAGRARPSGRLGLATAFAEAEARAGAALEAAFSGPAGAVLSEPLVAWTVAAALPDDALLFVASSMPIRDVDAFGGCLRAQVLANRGVNGIDGAIASAAGAGAATGRSTVLLAGDLAVLHDLGGLVAARGLGVDLTVVVVNNDGGGIFSFLPIAGMTPQFEALFGTPHGLDFAHVAALASARLHRPRDPAALAAALGAARGEGGLQLIEVRTDRARNVAEHRALQACVAAALEGSPWS